VLPHPDRLGLLRFPEQSQPRRRRARPSRRAQPVPALPGVPAPADARPAAGAAVVDRGARHHRGRVGAHARGAAPLPLSSLVLGVTVTSTDFQVSITTKDACVDFPIFDAKSRSLKQTAIGLVGGNIDTAAKVPIIEALKNISV